MMMMFDGPLHLLFSALALVIIIFVGKELAVVFVRWLLEYLHDGDDAGRWE